jgi:tRNA threonylcarbamoyladenosine biosynthesis protein TsaE
VRIETNSESATEAFGERLARALEPGDVVGLVGPLGAGKTALVRGVARGLGVDDGMVHSPTFLSATEYEGGRVALAHVDLYRHEDHLPHPDWLAEILDGERIAVVEWFERLGRSAPGDVLHVTIAYGPTVEDRVLDVSASGPRARRVLDRLGGVAEAAA